MKNMKDWYKHWFNSNYYLLIYKNRNEAEAKEFVDLILNNIPVKKDWSIVDFCCGYGRLCNFLAKHGFEVTGVDFSEIFINKAKMIAESEGLKVNYIKCDIRKFNQPEKFDLGINFFTSFGYFSNEENELTFKNFTNSIKNEGWLVLDYLNVINLEKNLVPFEEFYLEHRRVFISRKIENDRVIKTITIEDNNLRETFVESVGLYDINYFMKLFTENGFKILSLFGDYSGNEFNSNSPRLIIISQKK